MEKNNLHVPVLLHETIELLNVKKGGIYVDCTTGRGGHSCEIYKKIGKEGKLICIDTDSEAIDYLTKKFAGKKNIIVVKGNFNQLESILKKNNIDKVDGILADLGVSSPMFDNEDRGFSYHNNGKIDMRMDLEQKNSAADIINNYSFAEMFKVFKTYGEIKNPRNVINVIIKRRKEHPILEIKELVEIIKNNTK
jgi:16S rRNA (cytosine1402-N4)-methyltransferase